MTLIGTMLSGKQPDTKEKILFYFFYLKIKVGKTNL